MSLPKKMSFANHEALGYVLGSYLGDVCAYEGKKKGNYKICLSVKDKDFVENFAKSVKELGLHCWKNYNTKRDRHLGVVHSKLLFQFLKNFNLEDADKMSSDFKRFLLRGLFDSDGWVSLSKPENPRKTVRGVGFVNSQKETIDMVKTILNQFEISNTVSKRHGSGFNKNGIYFYIYVHGEGNFRKFEKCIGFGIKRKKNILNKLLDSYNKEIKCGRCYKIVKRIGRQPRLEFCSSCSIPKIGIS